MMFCINNNFLSHVCYEHKPIHEYRHKRKKLTNEQRLSIWKKYNKKKITCKCPLFKCKTVLIQNIPHGYHMGHIKSLYNNGKDVPANMRPICASCNQKMGTSNYDEYNEIVKKTYYWDKKKHPKKCADCNNKINKKTYCLLEVGNKISIVCNDCHNKMNESESECESELESDSDSDSDSDYEPIAKQKKYTKYSNKKVFQKCAEFA